MDWAALETFCSLSKAFSATRRFVLIPARFIGVFSSGPLRTNAAANEPRRLHSRGAGRGQRHLRSTALIPGMQSIHWTLEDGGSSLRDMTTTRRHAKRAIGGS